MNREILDLYTDYLISSNHYRTATGLERLVDGEVSHDKVTRFLSKEDYESKELWKEVKSVVRNAENDGGILMFDDTIEEKPYTDESELICWHFDHASGTNKKGINLLSALVRYGDITLPVAFEVVQKTKIWCDLKTKKVKRASPETKNEMLRRMITVCLLNKILFKYILADSWYSSKENMVYIKKKKKDFILAIKSNRTIALSKKEKVKGKFKKVSQAELEEGVAVTAYIKGVDFPVLLIKQVFTNKDGSAGILYLACSDLSLDFDQIKKLYQKRWRIEEYHKSMKSNIGLEKSPTQTVRTQSNHIFAAICAFAKLECLSIKKCMNHFALKYKLIVKANRVALMELKKMKLACSLC